MSPRSLLRGYEDIFDLAFRTYSGVRKMLEISVQFSDSLNINFNKDLASVFLDVIKATFKEIKNPANVYHSHLQDAVNKETVLPNYSEDFSFGSNVGLMPDDFSFSPIAELVRFITNDNYWNFSVKELFNWWVFGTRND